MRAACSFLPPTSSMALLRILARLTLLYLFVHHCILPCSSAAGVDFIYNNGFRRASNLSLDGSASVLDSGALRLTDDRSHLTGHAFFDSPVRMLRARDGAAVSFSAAFVFQIATTGSRGGDGLAFVVAPSKALLPRNDDATGNASSNHVFAVVFDAVPGLPNETDGNRVGVALTGLASNVSEPAAYFADDDDGRRISVPLESAGPVQAWVDYDGRTKVLNVTIAPVSVATTRPRRPLISHSIDLLPIFKKDMYVGFSAATGNLASSHYILAWSFRTGGGGVVHAKPIDVSRLPQVPNPPAPPLSRSAVIKIVALACAATFVAIVAAIAAAIWLRQRAAVAETLEEWELDHPHRFAYKDLYKATKGFKDSELLGAGGFGKVYRGVLRPSGDVVAVKRISNNGTQGMREFVAEVASLGRMRHRNLVELRGWCKRGQDLLLVYEFMPNGSLDASLFGNNTPPPPPVLSWQQRFRILRGVAAGLMYLHEEWEQVVVHRDVKASNVLLGADGDARLGDFGLARLYDHGGDPNTTRVVGTVGYMSPEVFATGRATTATDVFAFGVLLLEVACGRRPVDHPTGVHLLHWVRELGVNGELLRAVDDRLQRCYDEDEAKLVLRLGLVCTQMQQEARPSMRQVCQYMDGKFDMEAEAMIVFTDDSVDYGSLASVTWSSCATMSAGSLQDGR